MEGQLQKRRWRVSGCANVSHGEVVQAKVVGARQNVGIGGDAPYELANDDAEGEDVGPVIVPLALEALGRHPVRAANRAQSVARIRVGYLRREAKVADDCGELGVALLDEHVFGG